MNKVELDPSDITTNTKNILTKKRCRNTDRKWIRKCPSCFNDLLYNTNSELQKAISIDAICRTCYDEQRSTRNGILYNSSLWVKNCSVCNKIQQYNSYKQFWRAKANDTLCKTCRPKTVENRIRAKLLRESVLTEQRWINDPITGKWTSKAEIEIFTLLATQHDVSSQFMIGRYSYDFYVPTLNLLIEYNGTYWHCDPRKYSSDYICKKRTAQEIWDRDECKKRLAVDKGYKFCVIWEADWKASKNKTTFLKDVINETCVIKQY